VTIAGIGVSVRDGRAELVDGHEVSGAEVIDVQAESPAAAAGMRSARMAALAPIISLVQAINRSFKFDRSDVIFAVDGERIRNTLDLAGWVEDLPTGERVYLTIARRGQRVQISVTAGDASRSQ
jgi:S1-C subfamily serine protease